MPAMILPSNIHACCGAYWAGPVCRRCGRHFAGGGQVETLPANGQNLHEDAGTAMGARKQPRRKKGAKAANRCHVCGVALPKADGIAESLLCEGCKKEGGGG